MITAFEDRRTVLFVKGELLEVHPAVERGLETCRDDDSSLGGDGRQHVFLVRAQDTGLALIREEDVRQPKTLAQVLLPENILFAFGRIPLESQAMIDKVQLQERMHLELQQIGV